MIFRWYTGNQSLLYIPRMTVLYPIHRTQSKVTRRTTLVLKQHFYILQHVFVSFGLEVFKTSVSQPWSEPYNCTSPIYGCLPFWNGDGRILETDPDSWFKNILSNCTLFVCLKVYMYFWVDPFTSGLPHRYDLYTYHLTCFLPLTPFSLISLI